jgi:hypothetical protein
VSATDQASRNPRLSPTYPQRVHLKERPALQEKLRRWDARVAAAAHELAALPEGPAGAARRKLYFQMLGARDQLHEAVRRLPMEVGSLYHEDTLRLQEAEAALERLFTEWEQGRS